MHLNQEKSSNVQYYKQERRFMRRILIISILFFFSCDRFQPKENIEGTKSENQELDVYVQILNGKVFEKQIISNGIVESLNKTDMRFKISERLKFIMVKNGQKVVKGDTLAILENALLKNQLDKARLDVTKAKNVLDENIINYGYKNSVEEEIDNNILRNLEVESGYLDALNKLENSTILYNQTILTAPFSGIIGNLKSKNGNYITSGDVFCTLIEQNKLEIVFSILESELFFIKKNQEVEFNLFFNQNGNYKGVITEINPIVNENGLIEVKAKINASNEKLFDGMNVKVFINQPVEGVVTIPKEALVIRTNREVVFTLENNLAKWNYVEVFDENGSSYAIKKGLNLGDTIVVSGNANLSNDAKVKATFVTN